MSARILIVDDEPNLLRLLEYSLRTRGYQVTTATDAKTALGIVGTSVQI